MVTFSKSNTQILHNLPLSSLLVASAVAMTAPKAAYSQTAGQVTSALPASETPAILKRYNDSFAKLRSTDGSALSPQLSPQPISPDSPNITRILPANRSAPVIGTLYRPTAQCFDDKGVFLSTATRKNCGTEVGELWKQTVHAFLQAKIEKQYRGSVSQHVGLELKKDQEHWNQVCGNDFVVIDSDKVQACPKVENTLKRRSDLLDGIPSDPKDRLDFGLGEPGQRQTVDIEDSYSLLSGTLEPESQVPSYNWFGLLMDYPGIMKCYSQCGESGAVIGTVNQYVSLATATLTVPPGLIPSPDTCKAVSYSAVTTGWLAVGGTNLDFVNAVFPQGAFIAQQDCVNGKKTAPVFTAAISFDPTKVSSQFECGIRAGDKLLVEISTDDALAPTYWEVKITDQNENTVCADALTRGTDDVTVYSLQTAEQMHEREQASGTSAPKPYYALTDAKKTETSRSEPVAQISGVSLTLNWPTRNDLGYQKFPWGPVALGAPAAKPPYQTKESLYFLGNTLCDDGAGAVSNGDVHYRLLWLGQPNSSGTCALQTQGVPDNRSALVYPSSVLGTLAHN